MLQSESSSVLTLHIRHHSIPAETHDPIRNGHDSAPPWTRAHAAACLPACATPTPVPAL